jgi:hypothetical protein
MGEAKLLRKRVFTIVRTQGGKPIRSRRVIRYSREIQSKAFLKSWRKTKACSTSGIPSPPATVTIGLACEQPIEEDYVVINRCIRDKCTLGRVQNLSD